MNWDKIGGEWKQIQGQIKSKWAKLTDDDVKTLEAKKDALVGKIQERYGILRDEAEKQVDEWIGKVNTKPTQPQDQKQSRPREQGSR